MPAETRTCSIAAAALVAVLTVATHADASRTHENAQTAQDARQASSDEGWTFYGGDAGGTRFAAHQQITRDNVAELEVAWSFRTGELGEGLANAEPMGFEATPILARGTLYVSTPTNIVIALDPATGRERWRFDPRIARGAHYGEVISRGVSSWIDSDAAPDSRCAHRIFIGTLDGRLIALDGRAGQPCTEFGGTGAVDLTHGLPEQAKGAYRVISPPAIYRDLVIVGSASSSEHPTSSPGGAVRAYDARTGALRWSWKALPAAQGEAARRGGESPPAQRTSVSAGSMFSVDTGRGLVFIPTGSAGVRYQGEAHGTDSELANSLMALRAHDGELVWRRQLIRNDLWGYDLAAQPLLIDIEREGKSIAAVAQATKTGMLFVFDRESGEPVFEIVERPVPASDIPMANSSPTQPLPTTPPLISHAAITPEDAWGLTFYDRGKCRARIERHRSEGLYTPPSARGTIVWPSETGGVSFGSLAFDSERQLVIAAVNHLAAVHTLIPATRAGDSPGHATYTVHREMLRSPWGLPCTPPPWGTLAAVDLRRNTIRWQVMLGSTAGRTPWFVPARTLGMPNLGGPLVTAGGLVFIGATTDRYLRAFDVETGRELWKARLPAGGQATPMSYISAGRQYVVIAAGGHDRLGTARGDHIVAFALP